MQTLSSCSPSARLDAELLVMHVCGLRRSELLTRDRQPLTAEQATEIDELIARRRHGEPIAYLTGRREFWSLDLSVSPATLVPRPETELLVERALARIPLEAAWSIADLGTGSGAIALAIAGERPRCRMVATDNSSAALAIARANAARLNLAVDFRLGDWLAPLAGETFDLLVSNPPYVADQDPHLAALRHEPMAALAAGPDGLDALRAIAAAARAALKPGGWLLLEHGHDQGAAAAALLRQHGYGAIRCYPDLAGRDRVSEGWAVVDA
ncbi:MAG: peptide chain release factor N(5)-glutamine methyltransferase [Gammaproteobacteria bacterium]|nr:peptide chain release factor N(5)-glutamine methyltransferase [Gammaproteobacteria bacterium]